MLGRLKLAVVALGFAAVLSGAIVLGAFVMTGLVVVADIRD